MQEVWRGAIRSLTTAWVFLYVSGLISTQQYFFYHMMIYSCSVYELVLMYKREMEKSLLLKRLFVPKQFVFMFHIGWNRVWQYNGQILTKLEQNVRLNSEFTEREKKSCFSLQMEPEGDQDRRRKGFLVVLMWYRKCNQLSKENPVKIPISDIPYNLCLSVCFSLSVSVSLPLSLSLPPLSLRQTDWRTEGQTAWLRDPLFAGTTKKWSWNQSLRSQHSNLRHSEILVLSGVFRCVHASL